MLVHPPPSSVSVHHRMSETNGVYIHIRVGLYVRCVLFKLHLSDKFSLHKRTICSVSKVKDCVCVSACFMASRRFYGCWSWKGVSRVKSIVILMMLSEERKGEAYLQRRDPETQI